MASSMFESILATITPEMIQSLTGRLGGSPAAVQQGLSAATAATLHGLSGSSGEPGFVDQLMQMVDHAGSQNIGSIASSGPSGATGDLVGRFTSLVFGRRQEQVASVVAEHSGLSGNAGSTLLKTAAALVLGWFARMRTAGSLNPSTLISGLRSEEASLSSYVPGNFLRRLGGTVSDTAARATGYASDNASRVAGSASDVVTMHARRAAPARGMSWAIPVAAVVFAALIALWAGSRHGHRAVSSTAAIQTPRNANGAAPAPDQSAAPTSSVRGAPVAVSLPDGTQLNVASDGVEARLVGYLQDPGAQDNGVTWFDFDRLLFDSGKPTLQEQSNQQLDNVAAILKAYPSVKVRLGGYTDNTGDATANQALSQQRAQSVMTALVQRGIDPSRLSAQGYGADNPVADNSTAEGRQKNRRISIRVAEK